MTTETTTIDVQEKDQDLDAFSDEFFGKAKPEEDINANDSTEEDDSLATEPTPTEETVEETEESEDDDDDQVEDEDEKPTFIPKKKQTAKERITELNAKWRETERELEAARRELEAARAAKPEAKEQEPTKTVDAEVSRPDPDAKKDDGTPQYPLGEFDPDYIRDLTKYSFELTAQEYEQKRAREQEEQQLNAHRTEITQKWQEKITEAEAEYQDFRTSTAKLESQFANLDPQYGMYLAETIMTMDRGPDVLYYLSQHPDEAHAIVTAGPTQATIALGRLEAQFLGKGRGKNEPKVTSAPEPPKILNKGRSVTREIPDDTEDLEAFEKKFFKK